MPSDFPLATLHLTEPERLVVVALSYLYYAPVVWSIGRKLTHYLYDSIFRIRSQLREKNYNR